MSGRRMTWPNPPQVPSGTSAVNTQTRSAGSGWLPGLGVRDGLCHGGGDGLASLGVVLAFRHLAHESVTRLGGWRAADIDGRAVDEDPRQRPCGLVRRVDSLMFQQKVSQLREELVLCLGRQRALGDVSVEHRHEHVLLMCAVTRE